MIKDVYITETNCITPIGFDVSANIKSIGNEVSGIQLHDKPKLLNIPFYASIIDDAHLDLAFAKVTSDKNFSKLEKMMILALEPIIKKSKVVQDKRTGFILSTTKGNVTALENQNIEPAYLNQLAQKVADFFEFKVEPIVVSNACVSGIAAVSVAKRLIQADMYDNVFIVAGDEVSKFVLSGFNSFQAMSDSPCKPYSINRNGVTLGEASAAVLVSSNIENAKIKIIGDGSINDANHISGPSRTGEGLYRSIQSALAEAQNSTQIDYISAHGTATPFNDEMEAIALNRLGLENVPVNSFKGFYGHTLGASGLLETVIGIQSVLESKLFVSLGFDVIGVSQPINVIKKNQDKDILYFLKTASGFGGSNTAVVFEKVN
ncbi:beta-ketoacyl synthase N-terminal-like domain-containing protein [Flavobacterium granuli]|uniref:3-oxoacyl-[acyl-carrier-protein] synthase-1 n=1 Tax=Flavobacterium granuli TaxID=280093 RepID=A0ABU1RZK5_9FLAO|nr:beta-ketoacyl synthase N-terminal-like domain-containing protein [Flavobacterium granuli]MDR6843395.1 3-oxoacyl-[acyl-carrier-protein] synthase-1 [Flavobacterium granuli]